MFHALIGKIDNPILYLLISHLKPLTNYSVFIFYLRETLEDGQSIVFCMTENLKFESTTRDGSPVSF